MVQLFAFEVDLGAAQLLGQPLGEIERRRAADIVGGEVLDLSLELRVDLRGAIGFLEIEDQRHQRFGDETAAIEPKATLLVGAVAKGIGPGRGHCRTPTRVRLAPHR